ncbi:MAG: hypothetical protein PWQ55_1330 [Chloroflexota bacterium]|nr:hypothetical protein [Chloroflexota bacterium]
MNIPTDWLTVITILLIILASFALYLLRDKREGQKKKDEPKMPTPLPDGGMDLPVLEIYSGLRGLGSFTLLHNKKSPKLTLTADGLAYKVTRERLAAYDQIKFVRATNHPFYFKAHIIFKDRRQSLIAYLANAESLLALARFLEGKGVRVEMKK